MSNIDTESDFAPIDDVMDALTSLPGIDNDKADRAARQQQAERAAPDRGSSLYDG